MSKGACSNWFKFGKKYPQIPTNYPAKSMIGSKESRDWYQGGLLTRFQQWVKIPDYIRWMSSESGQKKFIKEFGQDAKNVILIMLDNILYYTSQTTPLTGFSDLKIPASTSSNTTSYVDMSAIEDIYVSIPYIRKQNNSTVEDAVFEVYITPTANTKTDKFVNLEFSFPVNKFDVDPIPDTTTPSILINSAGHLNRILVSLLNNPLLDQSQKKKVTLGLMDAYVLPKCEVSLRPVDQSILADYSASALRQLTREIVDPNTSNGELTPVKLYYPKISNANKIVSLNPRLSSDGKSIAYWEFGLVVNGVQYNSDVSSPTGGFMTSSNDSANNYLESYGDMILFSCDDTVSGGYILIHQRTITVKRKNREQVSFPLFAQQAALEQLGLQYPFTWEKLSRVTAINTFVFQTILRALLKNMMRKNIFTTDSNYERSPLFVKYDTSSTTPSASSNISLSDVADYFWKGKSKIISTGENALLSVSGTSLILEERKSCKIPKNLTGTTDNLASDSDDNFGVDGGPSGNVPILDSFPNGFNVSLQFMFVNNGVSSENRGVVEKVSGRALGVIIGSGSSTAAVDLETRKYSVSTDYYPSANSNAPSYKTFSIARTMDPSAQRVLSAHPQAQEMTQQTRIAGGARVSFANLPPAPSSQ